ncbi:hypothetical protein [Nocardia sp. CA-120079]|uniref:hypothetical protein n=1 Tax=Nocardia sp. CA-120079 TaxID=3239974 RepID=UPI003D974552
MRGRLLALDTAGPRAADPAPDPVVEVIGTELHRLRRRDSIATIVTRGGYLHEQMRISAVHRHHTVLHRHPDEPGVLLPLAFIESVAAAGVAETCREEVNS